MYFLFVFVSVYRLFQVKDEIAFSNANSYGFASHKCGTFMSHCIIKAPRMYAQHPTHYARFYDVCSQGSRFIFQDAQSSALSMRPYVKSRVVRCVISGLFCVCLANECASWIICYAYVCDTFLGYVCAEGEQQVYCESLLNLANQ